MTIDSGLSVESTSCRELGARHIHVMLQQAEMSYLATDMHFYAVHTDNSAALLTRRTNNLQQLLNDLSTVIPGAAARVSSTPGLYDNFNRLTGTTIRVTITWEHKRTVLFYWWWAALLQRIVFNCPNEFNSIEAAFADSNWHSSAMWDSGLSADKTNSLWHLVRAGVFTTALFNRYSLAGTRGPEQAYTQYQAMHQRSEAARIRRREAKATTAQEVALV